MTDTRKEEREAALDELARLGQEFDAYEGPTVNTGPDARFQEMWEKANGSGEFQFMTRRDVIWIAITAIAFVVCVSRMLMGVT